MITKNRILSLFFLSSFFVSSININGESILLNFVKNNTKEIVVFSGLAALIYKVYSEYKTKENKKKSLKHDYNDTESKISGDVPCDSDIIYGENQRCKEVQTHFCCDKLNEQGFNDLLQKSNITFIENISKNETIWIKGKDNKWHRKDSEYIKQEKQAKKEKKEQEDKKRRADIFEIVRNRRMHNVLRNNRGIHTPNMGSGCQIS